MHRENIHIYLKKKKKQICDGAWVKCVAHMKTHGKFQQNENIQNNFKIIEPE
jgi:hypothetical protein